MDIRLDRDLTLSVFCRLSSVQEKKCIPILMYHGISDSIESVTPYYRLTTSPRRFAEQMRWLQESGFTGVSLEEALDFMDNGRQGKAFPVGITFDDGFHDFYTAAWPIL